MAKENLDSNKKKPHCLRNCLITTLVVIVVLCGAIFGGGYFAYEKFGRPVLGISLWDVFGIMGSIGKYDEEKIVDNPFTDEDLAGFYSNLEKATYLDLPADFRISKAVNASMEGKGAAPAPLEGEENTKLSPINNFTTKNAYLDSVLKETGFAFDKLKGYNNGGSQLVLKDTEFAAVMDEIMRGLETPETAKMESMLGIKMSELLSVKQVKITGVKTLSEAILEGEPTEVVDPGSDAPLTLDPLKSDIKISLVLCLNLGQNVSNIIKSKAPSVPGFVGDMAAGMLPKKIFVGAGVYPYNPDKAPEIFINEVEGKVMDNLLKAISGIMTKMGSETTTDAVFSKVSNIIVKTINTMENMVGELRFVDSSMNLDPITAMMSIMKVNQPDPVTGSRDHYLTSHDFLAMLKHIYNSDNEIAGFVGEKDVEQYLNTSIGGGNSEKGKEHRVTKEGYSDSINNISRAYGIDPTKCNMAEWKPKDFATNFKTVHQYIDIKNATIDGTNIGRPLYSIPQDEMMTYTLLTDNALGYMFNDSLKDMMKDGIGGLPFEMEVKSFEIYELNDDPDKLRARFVGSVSTTKILESISKDAVLYKLFTTSMPEHLFMEFDVRFSPDPEHGPGLIMNFVGKDKEGRDKTAAVFDTLYRIMVAIDQQMGDKIKLDNFLNEIQKAVDKMIEELEKLGEKADAPAEEPIATAKNALPRSLPKPTVHVKKGGLQLPTIYDIIKKASKSKIVIVDPTDITKNVPLTPELVQHALNDLYTYDSARSIVNPRLKNEAMYNSTPELIGGLPPTAVSITDYFIGYQLIKSGEMRGAVVDKNIVDDLHPDGKHVADVEQMAILSGTQLDNIRAKAMTEDNVYTGVFADTQTEGMILSIKVFDTQDYLSALPENMPNILPKEIHANIVLDIVPEVVDGVPTGNKMISKIPLVNNMNRTDMAVINAIMGQGNTFDNINEMVEKQVLKKIVYGDITLAEILSKGVYTESVDEPKGTLGKVTLALA